MTPFLQKSLQRAKKAFVLRFGRELGRSVFSAEILDVQRCTRGDVLSAVALARANHPGAPIYVLSDVSFGEIAGTRPVRRVEDLASAAAPSAVILACNSDELALAAVTYIKSREGMFYYGANRAMPPARYFHRDDHALAALKDGVAAGLAKLDIADFENIAQALHATRDLEGDYVEIGVYKGSSAFFALAYLGRSGIRRRSYFLDTFEGFNYDGVESSADRIWAKTHTDTSHEAVQALLSRFKTPWQLVRANVIADPLPDGVRQIAVCNIDVDMYEAVAAALAKVAPLIPVGGIIIAEDPGHTPLLIGAYAAVQEFLATEAGRAFVPVQLTSGQTFLVRTG